MDDLLLRTVESFLGEYMEKTHVYSDFLLLTVDYADTERSHRLGDIEFQGQKWSVWLIDCELSLRRAMVHEQNVRAILIFSISGDVEISIPPDIKARSHHRGLVPIGLRHRLIAETNRQWPEEVNRDEWKPTVLRHYDNLKTFAPEGGLPITRNELETLIVKAAFGIEVSGRKAPEIIAELDRNYKAGKPFPLELEVFKGQLALHEIEHPKIIAWIAKEPGRPRTFLITGAIMRVEFQAGLTPSWGDLQKLLGILLESNSQEEALKIVDKLVWQSWNVLHVNEKRHLMAKVERKLEQYQTVKFEKFNDMLPRSLRYAIESTAFKLAKEDRASYAHTKLENHLFANDERESLETLRIMARILEQKEKFQDECRTERSSLEWLHWYQMEGSFSDLDALSLVIEGSAKLARETDEILQGYWDVRSQANRTFADEFLLNYEESIYAKGVIGTHKIIDRLLLPALEKKNRILLIVLDGLGYPGLIHLVRNLDTHDQQSIGIVSEHLAISILPSVTAASRKAIFLGKCPVDSLDSEEEYEEKSRTTEEAALKQGLSSYSVKLHNRTTLTASGGQLSLFSDLQNANIDLVGLVLNEVDESLASGSGPRLWYPEDLGVFLEAVKDGLNAGRRVFLVSDHGHTWHINKEHRQGAQVPGGSQRYLPLEKDDKAPANTIATSDPNILHSPQAERIAFLYRVGDYFGQIPRRGYHGGVGLEEVVIPCVELGYGGEHFSSVEEPAGQQEQGDELDSSPIGDKGIVLELSDGGRITFDLPDLSTIEIQAFQLLAKYGRINEQQLRENLHTRRVAGLMSKLIEKLAVEGFDLIRISGGGSYGNEYEFKAPAN